MENRQSDMHADGARRQDLYNLDELNDAVANQPPRNNNGQSK